MRRGKINIANPFFPVSVAANLFISSYKQTTVSPALCCYVITKTPKWHFDHLWLRVDPHMGFRSTKAVLIRERYFSDLSANCLLTKFIPSYNFV